MVAAWEWITCSMDSRTRLAMESVEKDVSDVGMHFKNSNKSKVMVAVLDAPT